MCTREFCIHRSCTAKPHASHTYCACSARGRKLHGDVTAGYS
ncbi:hypothetical protein HMPREF0091_10794 [Fannyhessea vaginae DSM 15829]|uniref:Uncharacterized protein n=1 Tax=Fannyhessea vaginae DSM 15829 TaxID=525256 RepID=F1T5B6_9ACTN|nr:hypothetical protein HMPREF0091_10794 [Fannyhessea vaginae DSM 15829]